MRVWPEKGMLRRMGPICHPGTSCDWCHVTLTSGLDQQCVSDILWAWPEVGVGVASNTPSSISAEPPGRAAGSAACCMHCTAPGLPARDRPAGTGPLNQPAGTCGGWSPVPAVLSRFWKCGWQLCSWPGGWITASPSERDTLCQQWCASPQAG